MFPKGTGYKESESDNLPLKTGSFLSYRNRLEFVSPLLLRETHQLFSLWTPKMYCFSQVRDVYVQTRSYLADYSKVGDQVLWELVRNANSLVLHLLNQKLWGWDPAKAEESLVLITAGQTSGKEGQHGYMWMAYLKCFMNHVWRPKSRPSLLGNIPWPQ